MFKNIFWLVKRTATGEYCSESGRAMPYPVGHRAEVKKKIVESARKLFNRHGFDNISVDQIMSGAGLTRGGHSASGL